jgi:hypothetical protein
MLRTRQRIERLEQAIMPLRDDFPKELTIQFVDSDRKVVEERVFKLAPPWTSRELRRLRSGERIQ